MLDKRERLIAELRGRYALDDAFVARIRPILDRVLDARVPDGERPQLLDLLAFASEQSQAVRKAVSVADEALAQLVSAVQRVFSRIDRSVEGGETSG